MKGRRGRRRKLLQDDLKEKRGYCKLKDGATDRNLWRTRFGRGYGPVVRQTEQDGDWYCSFSSNVSHKINGQGT